MKWPTSRRSCKEALKCSSPGLHLSGLCLWERNATSTQTPCLGLSLDVASWVINPWSTTHQVECSHVLSIRHRCPVHIATAHITTRHKKSSRRSTTRLRTTHNVHTPWVIQLYKRMSWVHESQRTFYDFCLWFQNLQRDAFARRSTPVVQRNATPNQQGSAWNPQASPSPSSYPSRPNSANKKVPPEVPKRTSSISCRSTPDSMIRGNGLSKTFENGSLSSVQSSGSDSSISIDRVPTEGAEGESRNRSSPVWKRKTQVSKRNSKWVSRI